MKYICNECGAVFDKIPRVYRGFSGDNFGGGETMLPGCTHCGKYDFSQYTDDGHREILTLRDQVKVLREALDSAKVFIKNGLDLGYIAPPEFGDPACDILNETYKALAQTKPKEGE